MRIRKLNLELLFYYLFLFEILSSLLMVIPSIFSSIFYLLMILVGSVLMFKSCRVKFNKINQLWFIFMCIALLSLITSEYFSLQMVISYIHFFYASFVVINVLSNSKNINHYMNMTLKVFFLLSVFSVLYSLLFYLLPTSKVSFTNGLSGYKISILGIPFNQIAMGIKAQGDFGVASFFINPNTFGLYCAIGLLINNSAILFPKKKIVLILIANVLLVLGLIQANSRGAYLLAASLLIIYITLKKGVFSKKRNPLKYIFFIVVILGIILFIEFDGIQFIIQQIMEGNGRNEMWLGLINKIQQKPLLGYGFSSASKYINLDIAGSVAPHNVYLTILAEFGIIGFLYFLYFYACSIIKGLKKYKIDKNNTSLFCASFLIALLFYIFIENPIMVVAPIHFFWLLILSYINKQKGKVV